MTSRVDVVVVGAGPTGAATASWLARRGHEVVMVDRGSPGASPGQLISPHATRQLLHFGIDPRQTGWHHHRGLSIGRDRRTTPFAWGTDTREPVLSYAASRDVIAQAIVARAHADGATALAHHEVTEPLIERGFVRGTRVRCLTTGAVSEVEANYVVVADGAGSRFGRALGTLRTKDWPSLTVVRGQWDSTHGFDEWVETSVGVVTPEGERVVVMIQVIPLGEAGVSVEVHVPSTARQASSLQLGALLHHVMKRVASRWALDAQSTPSVMSTQRLPVGWSVRPRSGPTFLVVGDAVAAINPFQGDGLGPGLQAAEFAAEAIHHAVATGDPTALAAYSRRLDEYSGRLFAAGRLYLRCLSQPVVARALPRLALGLPSLTSRTISKVYGLSVTDRQPSTLR